MPSTDYQHHPEELTDAGREGRREAGTEGGREGGEERAARAERWRWWAVELESSGRHWVLRYPIITSTQARSAESVAARNSGGGSGGGGEGGKSSVYKTTRPLAWCSGPIPPATDMGMHRAIRFGGPSQLLMFLGLWAPMRWPRQRQTTAAVLFGGPFRPCPSASARRAMAHGLASSAS